MQHKTFDIQIHKMEHLFNNSQQLERYQSTLEVIEQKMADTGLYESDRKSELDKILVEQKECKEKLRK